jgi:GNAT superfamily N-acetyltransferase
MATVRILDSEAVMEYRRGEFVISTDRQRLSLDVIHNFLTNCYWAKGIPRDIVARSIEHSLCFGIYDESPPFGSPQGRLLAKDARPGAPAQVGFARVISDFATIAYLGDVFVLGSHRGRGLSKWMMDSLDSRCPRTLFAVRLHPGQSSGAIYGDPPTPGIRDALELLGTKKT